MIAQLKGNLLTRRPDQVVLDVNGVGYQVFVSLNTFYSLPEPGSGLELLIQTVVREDAIHLYGFGAEAEREAFLALCSVSGVGPKLAMGILSGIAPDQLWMAVHARDTKRLVKVPGIGKKTAARLVVELEGKLPQPEGQGEDGAAAPSPGGLVGEDALSALMNLGYPEATARKQVEGALNALGAEANLEDLLKEALKGSF